MNMSLALKRKMDLDPISLSRCGDVRVCNLREMRHVIDKTEAIDSRMTNMCEEMKLDVGIDPSKIGIGRVGLDIDKFVSKEVFVWLVVSMANRARCAFMNKSG